VLLPTSRELLRGTAYSLEEPRYLLSALTNDAPLSSAAVVQRSTRKTQERAGGHLRAAPSPGQPQGPVHRLIHSTPTTSLSLPPHLCLVKLCLASCGVNRICSMVHNVPPSTICPLYGVWCTMHLRPLQHQTEPLMCCCFQRSSLISVRHSVLCRNNEYSEYSVTHYIVHSHLSTLVRVVCVTLCTITCPPVPQNCPSGPATSVCGSEKGPLLVPSGLDWCMDPSGAIASQSNVWIDPTHCLHCLH
jgi:hypothetical protein